MQGYLLKASTSVLFMEDTILLSTTVSSFPRYSKSRDRSHDVKMAARVCKNGSAQGNQMAKNFV